MAATLTDPLLGHLIDGRYEVLSRIARGGMATVYLATDRRLEREVAVKVMHQHLAEGASGADFVARFRREARAAARLTHPGLVSVLDQGVDGEVSYLIMEYVPGPTLRRHLDDAGALTLGEALRITDAVLDALAAAHRAGLVHRDVKPENVLLDADGRVRVTDFGLARAVTEVTATMSGTVLGTVGYLAPELMAHGVCDARTDVYAAGILLYEMLTGTLPFAGTTPIQVAYQQVNTDVPPVSDTVAWVPAEVDDLVASLGARDPHERFVDAASALTYLRQVTADLDEELLARRAAVAPRGVAVTPDGLPRPPGPPGPGEDAAGDERAASDGTTVLDDAVLAGAVGVGRDRRTEVVDPRGAAPVRLGGASSAVEVDGRGLPMSRTVALRIGTGLEPDEEPVEAPTRRRWPKVVAWLVALAVVGGGLAWGASWYVTEGPGAYTHIPERLVLLEQTRVEGLLTAAGLEFRTDRAFDPEIREGLVLAVDPGEGERIRRDAVVQVTVSRGPDLRVVPQIPLGTPVDDAAAMLTNAGFVVPEPETVYDDEMAAGGVLAVDTEAGALLPVDTEVRLTVSAGPAPATVVSVVGVPVDRARADLEELGFLVDLAEDYSEDFAEGHVIAQSPEANTAAHRRDTVTLTVSLGMPFVEVPDVLHKEIGEAREILRAAGFEVTYTQAWFWDTRVVVQSPEGGTQARKGSTVELRLN